MALDETFEIKPEVATLPPVCPDPAALLNNSATDSPHRGARPKRSTAHVSPRKSACKRNDDTGEPCRIRAQVCVLS